MLVLFGCQPRNRVDRFGDRAIEGGRFLHQEAQRLAVDPKPFGQLLDLTLSGENAARLDACSS